MNKDRRLYGRFTHDFADSPKIAPLSDKAFRTLVEMTLWSARMMTDGIVPSGVASRFWNVLALDELCANDVLHPSLRRLEDGSYEIHDFTDHQTTKREIEAKREAGRAGGLKKASTSVAPATNLLEQKASAPLANTEVRSKKIHTPAVAVDESDFDAAYSHWPKKTDRKKSFEKFKKCATTRGLEQLKQDVIRFGDAYARTTDRQYVPSLATWLHNERWTDDLPGAGTKPLNPERPAAPEGRRYAVDAAQGVNW